MKVFISWSGEKSRQIALVLKEWLPTVIRPLRPYVSSEDIGKGSRWSKELESELASSEFGILCLTRENMDAPWLMFEAGALSKMGISRITPFLFDMQPPEVTGPMQLFQATIFDKRDIRSLAAELNRNCGPDAMDEKQLGNTFERWYPDLERRLNALRNMKTGNGDGRQARLAADIAAIRRMLEEDRSDQAKAREDFRNAWGQIMDANAALQRNVDALRRRG